MFVAEIAYIQGIRNFIRLIRTRGNFITFMLSRLTDSLI